MQAIKGDGVSFFSTLELVVHRHCGMRCRDSSDENWTQWQSQVDSGSDAEWNSDGFVELAVL